MKKRRRGQVTSLAVFLMLISLNGGCEQSPNVSTQRDDYQSMEDCVNDWGSPEACQFEDDDDGHRYFRGPTYYHGNRMAHVNGQAFSPVTNRAVASKPVSFSSPTSIPANVGGFGKTGATFASAGSE